MKNFSIGLILAPFSYMWQGYVFATIWEWFIVSSFSLPVISVPVAIGIILLCQFPIFPSIAAMNASLSNEKQSNERRVAINIFAFVYPLFTLIIASIVKLFM